MSQATHSEYDHSEHRKYLEVFLDEIILGKLSEDSHWGVHGLDSEDSWYWLVDYNGLIELESNIHLRVLNILQKIHLNLKSSLGILHNRTWYFWGATDIHWWGKVHFVEVGNSRLNSKNKITCVLVCISKCLHKVNLGEFSLIRANGLWFRIWSIAHIGRLYLAKRRTTVTLDRVSIITLLNSKQFTVSTWGYTGSIVLRITWSAMAPTIAICIKVEYIIAGKTFYLVADVMGSCASCHVCTSFTSQTIAIWTKTHLWVRSKGHSSLAS